MGQWKSGTLEVDAFRIDYRRSPGALDLTVLCLTCRTGVPTRTLGDLRDFADGHGPGVCSDGTPADPA